MNSPVLKIDIGRQRYHQARDQPSLAGIRKERQVFAARTQGHCRYRSLNQPRGHDFPLFGDFIPLIADLIQPPMIAGSSASDRSNERKVFISQVAASGVVSL
jgi:hypothetical protein